MKLKFHYKSMFIVYCLNIINSISFFNCVLLANKIYIQNRLSYEIKIEN